MYMRQNELTIAVSYFSVQMTNSWRAIARQARDRIVEADPEDVPYILSVSALVPIL